MDFQVREPVSPLLTGLLPNTNVMMEVQAAQEYTGQAGESPHSQPKLCLESIHRYEEDMVEKMSGRIVLVMC